MTIMTADKSGSQREVSWNNGGTSVCCDEVKLNIIVGAFNAIFCILSVRSIL